MSKTNHSVLFKVPQNAASETAIAKHHLVIKKSDFITFAFSLNERTAMLDAIAMLKTEYPDARHICWAYIIANGTSAAMSDDGEPSGTAGKPILNVLQHNQLSNTAIAVVRYFGGTKLGAGGLIRAYSQAAQAVIEKIEFITPTPLCRALITCDFSLEQEIRRQLDLFDGRLVHIEYQQHVIVHADIAIAQKTAFSEKMAALKVSITLTI